MQPERTTQTSTGLAMILAALIAIASPALEWNVVTSKGDVDVLNGTDTSAGMGTLGFGFVLLLLAAALLARGRRTGGRKTSIIATVVSSAILIVNVYSAVDPGDALVWLESEDLATAYGLSEDQIEQVLHDALDRGDLVVTAEQGPWVGIVPGLLGAVAGVAAIRRSGRIRRENALAPPTPLG